MKMKKFICGVLIGSICTLSIGSLASGVWDNISVLRNDIKVVVDGEEVTADNFLYEDTTYLPLRAVSEALNKTVEYDNNTNTAYIGERKDNNLDNSKNKYVPFDNLIHDEQNASIEEINGKYYITIRGMERAVNNNINILGKEIDDDSCCIIFYTGAHYTEDSKELFKYNIKLIEGRCIIPYDTFMDEIYPYIK